MRIQVKRSVSIEETARVLQTRGLMEVQPAAESAESWDVDLPIEDREWSVGMIVGPSGSGKTTIAREAFGSAMIDGFAWSPTQAILDGFPAGMSIKDVLSLLSSVGFASPPAWLRPFHVLSTGQQFRVTVARALAEMPALAVIDEFTSVVDRQVAMVGSCAVAKAVRKSGRKLVAVACHYDIIDWLQPDWILDMADGSFTWRSVQPRPRIEVTLRRVHRSAWGFFKKHHYMSGEHHAGAHCYAAFVEGAPVAYLSVLSFPHPTVPGWRGHRKVVLPDWQGVGIGEALSDKIAEIYAATGKPYYMTMAHPWMLRRAYAHPEMWRPTSDLRVRGSSRGRTATGGANAHNDRLTASFRWVGPTSDPGPNVDRIEAETRR